MKYTGTAGILYDRLKSEIMVADGAFGTYYAKKYDTGSLPELANLQASDRVLAIHKEYIESGSIMANGGKMNNGGAGGNGSISVGIIQNRIYESKKVYDFTFAFNSAYLSCDFWRI